MSFIVTHVEPLSFNSIRVYFDTAAVVNSAYNNVLNYVIIAEESGIPLEVIQVVPTSKIVMFYANLYVRSQTPGITYRITVNNLQNRAEELMVDSYTGWVYNRTKIDSFNASLPKIYDKRPISNLGQIVAAIAYSDNIIGGIPSDISDAVDLD